MDKEKTAAEHKNPATHKNPASHKKPATRKNASRTRSLAFIALSVAIMAVSAWITVPIGTVPFTLQIFALIFALLVLEPRECLAAVACYLALGAVGVPVFSSMRGGIGVLAGPTGGFLWGYLIGACAALFLLMAMRKSALPPKLSFVCDALAGMLFIIVTYLCGWAQYMVVMGVSAKLAFVSAIAPFVLIDFAKLIAAVACARAVRVVVK